MAISRGVKRLPGHEKAVAFVFGLVFIIASLLLAIFFPEPTPYQYTVFRIILALSASGTAVIIPGFIQVKLRNLVRAGGALAVFAIVYFFNPASLIVEARKPSSDNNHDIRASPIVKGSEVNLLDAPAGNTIAQLFGNTEIEIRERKGAFCEIYLYGYVFKDALREQRRGLTTLERPAYVWSNPFGWYDNFGVSHQPDNFRLGQLLRGSAVDVIEVEDPKVNIRKIRLIGWMPVSEIAGSVVYQRRLNGDLREWLSDGKVAIQVSDVTRGEGLKVYFQVRNPQNDPISLREVRALLFDERGGVRAEIRSLERQDIANIEPAGVRLFSIDSDEHPVSPNALELRIFLGDNSQSGPFIVTWDQTRIAGTEYD